MSKSKRTISYPDLEEVQAAGIGTGVQEGLAVRTPLESKARGTRGSTVTPAYQGRHTTIEEPAKVPRKGKTTTRMRMRVPVSDESVETEPVATISKPTLTDDVVDQPIAIEEPPTRRVAHKTLHKFLRLEGQRALAEWAAQAPAQHDTVSQTFVELSRYLHFYISKDAGPLPEDIEIDVERSVVPLYSQCPVGFMTCAKRRSFRKRETTYERDFSRPYGIDFWVMNLSESTVDVLDHIPTSLFRRLKDAGDVLCRYTYQYYIPRGY
ncbi:hypothetical protein P9112_006979 [Eukaryota sp. TZLM1-RC]